MELGCLWSFCVGGLARDNSNCSLSRCCLFFLSSGSIVVIQTTSKEGGAVSCESQDRVSIGNSGTRQGCDSLLAKWPCCHQTSRRQLLYPGELGSVTMPSPRADNNPDQGMGGGKETGSLPMLIDSPIQVDRYFALLAVRLISLCRT